MSRVVSAQGVGTPLTVTQNLDEITDEALLRQMWHDAQDTGERRRIRSRMYKLRERHLREMVQNDEENLGVLTISSDGSSSKTERRSSKTFTRKQSGSEQGANESESNEESSRLKTRRNSSNTKMKSDETRILSDEEIIEEKVKAVSKGRTDRYNRIMNEMDQTSSSKISSDKGYSVQSNALAGDSYQSMKKQEVRDSVSPSRSSYQRYSCNEESEGRTTSDEESSTRTVIRTSTRTTSSSPGTKFNKTVTRRRVSKELILPTHAEEIKTTSSYRNRTDDNTTGVRKSVSKNSTSNVDTGDSKKGTGSRKTITSSTVSTEHKKLGSYLMTEDPSDEIIEEEEEEEEDEHGNVVRTVVQTRRSKDGREYTARRVARTTKIVDSESDINEILIGNPDHELIDRHIEEKDEGDDSKIKIITETRRRPDGIEYTTRNVLKTSKIFDYDHPENVTYSDEDELMDSKESEEVDEQGIIIRTITETRKKPNGVEYITKKVYKTSKVNSRLPDDESKKSRDFEQKKDETYSKSSITKVSSKTDDRRTNQKRALTGQANLDVKSSRTVNTESSNAKNKQTKAVESKQLRERKTASRTATEAPANIQPTYSEVGGECNIQANSDDEILDDRTTEEVQKDGSTVKTRVERRKTKDGSEYLRHKILRIPKLPDVKLVVGSPEDEVIDKNVSEDVLEDGSECRAVTERRRSSVTGVLYTLRRMSRTFQPSCHLYGMDEIIDENTTEEETSDGVVIKTVIRRYRRGDDTVYTTHNVTKTYTSPLLVKSNHNTEDELVDRSYDIRETYDGFMIKTIMETRCRPDGVHYTVERTEKLVKPEDFDSEKVDLSVEMISDLDDAIISSEEHEEPGEEEGIVVKTILECRKRKDGTEYTNKITVKTTQFLAPQHETSYVIIKPDEKDGECSFMPSLDDDVLEVKKRRENDVKGNLMEVINETRLSRSTGKKYNLTKRVKITDVVITEEGQKILAKVTQSSKKDYKPSDKPISSVGSRGASKPKGQITKTPKSEAPKTSTPKADLVKFTSKTKTFETQKVKTTPKMPATITSGASVSERKKLFMGKSKESPATDDTRNQKATPKRPDVTRNRVTSSSPTKTSTPKASRPLGTPEKENKGLVTSTKSKNIIEKEKTKTEAKSKRTVSKRSPGETSTDSDCLSSNESRKSPGRESTIRARKSPLPASTSKVTRTSTSNRQRSGKVEDTQEKKLKTTASSKLSDKSSNESSSESSSAKRPNSIKIRRSDVSTKSPTSSSPSSPIKSPVKLSPIEVGKSRVTKSRVDTVSASRRTTSKPESPSNSSKESPLKTSTKRTPSRSKMSPTEDKQTSSVKILTDYSSDEKSPQKKREAKFSGSETETSKPRSKTETRSSFDDKFRKLSREDEEVKSSRLVRNVQSNQALKTEKELDASIFSQIIPDGEETGYNSVKPFTTTTDKVKKPFHERRSSVDDIKRPGSLDVRDKKSDSSERVPVVEPLVKKRYIYRLGEDEEETEEKTSKKCSSEDLGLTSTKLVLKTMSPEPNSPIRESSPSNFRSSKLRSMSPVTPEEKSTETLSRSFSKESSPGRFVTGKPIDQGPNAKKLKLLERTGSNKALYENSEEKEKELKPILQRVESISELEELEALLEKAKTYEERRIIRGRIRNLKKGVDSKTTTTVVKDTTFGSSTSSISKKETRHSPLVSRSADRYNGTPSSRDQFKPIKTTDEKKEPRAFTLHTTVSNKPDKEVESMEDYLKKESSRSSSRSTSTKVRKTSSEFEKRKLSFEREQETVTKTDINRDSRKSSLKSSEITQTRRKSSSQEESVSESESAYKRKTRNSTSVQENNRKKSAEVKDVSSYDSRSYAKPSKVSAKDNTDPKVTPKKKPELTAQAHVDTIMSPYGVGPTDENGVPLVGLRALKRRPRTTEEDTPTRVTEPPKQKDTITSSLFGLKSVQRKTVSGDRQIEDREKSPTRKDAQEELSSHGHESSHSSDSSLNTGDEIDAGRHRKLRKKCPPKQTHDTESEDEGTTFTNKMDQFSHPSNRDNISQSAKKDVSKSRQTTQSSHTSESETEQKISSNKNLKNIILMHESKASSPTPSSPTVTTPKRRLVHNFEPTKDIETRTHKTWDLESDLAVRSDDVGNIIAKHETLVKDEVSIKPKVGILKHTLSTSHKSSSESEHSVVETSRTKEVQETRRKSTTISSSTHTSEAEESFSETTTRKSKRSKDASSKELRTSSIRESKGSPLKDIGPTDGVEVVLSKIRNERARQMRQNSRLSQSKPLEQPSSSSPLKEDVRLSPLSSPRKVTDARDQAERVKKASSKQEDLDKKVTKQDTRKSSREKKETDTSKKKITIREKDTYLSSSDTATESDTLVSRKSSFTSKRRDTPAFLDRYSKEDTREVSLNKLSTKKVDREQKELFSKQKTSDTFTLESEKEKTRTKGDRKKDQKEKKSFSNKNDEPLKSSGGKTFKDTSGKLNDSKRDSGISILTVGKDKVREHKNQTEYHHEEKKSKVTRRESQTFESSVTSSSEDESTKKKRFRMTPDKSETLRKPSDKLSKEDTSSNKLPQEKEPKTSEKVPTNRATESYPKSQEDTKKHSPRITGGIENTEVSQAPKSSLEDKPSRRKISSNALTSISEDTENQSTVSVLERSKFERVTVTGEDTPHSYVQPDLRHTTDTPGETESSEFITADVKSKRKYFEEQMEYSSLDVGKRPESTYSSKKEYPFDKVTKSEGEAANINKKITEIDTVTNRSDLSVSEKERKKSLRSIEQELRVQEKNKTTESLQEAQHREIVTKSSIKESRTDSEELSTDEDLKKRSYNKKSAEAIPEKRKTHTTKAPKSSNNKKGESFGEHPATPGKINVESKNLDTERKSVLLTEEKIANEIKFSRNDATLTETDIFRKTKTDRTHSRKHTQEGNELGSTSPEKSLSQSPKGKTTTQFETTNPKLAKNRPEDSKPTKKEPTLAEPVSKSKNVNPTDKMPNKQATSSLVAKKQKSFSKEVENTDLANVERNKKSTSPQRKESPKPAAGVTKKINKRTPSPDSSVSTNIEKDRIISEVPNKNTDRAKTATSEIISRSDSHILDYTTNNKSEYRGKKESNDIQDKSPRRSKDQPKQADPSPMRVKVESNKTETLNIDLENFEHHSNDQCDTRTVTPQRAPKDQPKRSDTSPKGTKKVPKTPETHNTDRETEFYPKDQYDTGKDTPQRTPKDQPKRADTSPKEAKPASKKPEASNTDLGNFELHSKDQYDIGKDTYQGTPKDQPKGADTPRKVAKPTSKNLEAPNTDRETSELYPKDQCDTGKDTPQRTPKDQPKRSDTTPKGAKTVPEKQVAPTSARESSELYPKDQYDTGKDTPQRTPKDQPKKSDTTPKGAKTVYKKQEAPNTDRESSELYPKDQYDTGKDTPQRTPKDQPKRADTSPIGAKPVSKKPEASNTDHDNFELYSKDQYNIGKDRHRGTPKDQPKGADTPRKGAKPTSKNPEAPNTDRESSELYPKDQYDTGKDTPQRTPKDQPKRADTSPKGAKPASKEPEALNTNLDNFEYYSKNENDIKKGTHQRTPNDHIKRGDQSPKNAKSVPKKPKDHDIDEIPEKYEKDGRREPLTQQSRTITEDHKSTVRRSSLQKDEKLMKTEKHFPTTRRETFKIAEKGLRSGHTAEVQDRDIQNQDSSRKYSNESTKIEKFSSKQHTSVSEALPKQHKSRPNESPRASPQRGATRAFAPESTTKPKPRKSVQELRAKKVVSKRLQNDRADVSIQKERKSSRTQETKETASYRKSSKDSTTSDQDVPHYMKSTGALRRRSKPVAEKTPEEMDDIRWNLYKYTRCTKRISKAPTTYDYTYIIQPDDKPAGGGPGSYSIYFGPRERQNKSVDTKKYPNDYRGALTSGPNKYPSVGVSRTNRESEADISLSTDTLLQHDESDRKNLLSHEITDSKIDSTDVRVTTNQYDEERTIKQDSSSIKCETYPEIRQQYINAVKNIDAQGRESFRRKHSDGFASIQKSSVEDKKRLFDESFTSKYEEKVEDSVRNYANSINSNQGEKISSVQEEYMNSPHENNDIPSSAPWGSKVISSDFRFDKEKQMQEKYNYQFENKLHVTSNMSNSKQESQTFEDIPMKSHETSISGEHQSVQKTEENVNSQDISTKDIERNSSFNASQNLEMSRINETRTENVTQFSSSHHVSEESESSSSYYVTFDGRTVETPAQRFIHDSSRNQHENSGFESTQLHRAGNLSDQHIEYTDVERKESTSTQGETKQIISTSEMPDQKSFLSDSSKVSGIQDVLSRMGATEAVDHEAAVTSDDQAKSLLNKFLGAQVLMSGVESMMANSSMSSSNRQSSNQMSFAPPSFGRNPTNPAGGRVAAKTAMFTPKPAATTTIKNSSMSQESEPFIYKGVNINEVAESYELDELLDSCQEYEPRRRIQKRLGELLAKEKAELLGQINSSTRKIGSTGKVTTVLGSSLRSNEDVTLVNAWLKENFPEQTSKSANNSNSKGGSKTYATSTFSGPAPPGQFTGGQPGAKGKRNVSGPLFALSTSLNRSASGIKDMILNWCQCRTRGYQGVNIENFSTSWNDGMAFCALIHHFYPDAFDFNSLNPKNRKYNFQLAFRTADERAGVFPLLDVEDMVMMQKPDWKCVFTYVQTLYKRLKDE